MDNQADPAAQRAEKAADAAPELDETVRKSTAAEAESDEYAAGSSSVAVQAETVSPLSIAKAPGSNRSDVTTPKAAAPSATEAAPRNGRPDVPAKPLGAGAPDAVVAPRSATFEGRGTPDSGTPEPESTSALAAAALARELTGAGFASPGFASSAAASPDTLSKARMASSARPRTPSTSETNPAWRSPASAPG
ncbi:MAG TPA: hypothetical protein VEM58_13445, partial [Streptosporangiaceae bacterium]|nr:hypothetical protein [Streptosporangiaceae bacterium]